MAALNTHHWATPVRSTGTTHYFVVYCNHRHTALPDYLLIKVDEYMNTFTATTLQDTFAAYGMSVEHLFEGMRRIMDPAHINDAKSLTVEIARAMSGSMSERYSQYLAARRNLSNVEIAGSQYHYGMTPTNGAVGGHHTGTMGTYGAITPSNGVMGDYNTGGHSMDDHYGHTVQSHSGHSTRAFHDMGTGM